MTRSLLISIICIFVLSGCVNTYIEEKASLEFEPIYPTQEFEQPNRNINGSINYVAIISKNHIHSNLR